MWFLCGGVRFGVGSVFKGLGREFGDFWVWMVFCLMLLEGGKKGGEELEIKRCGVF